MVIEKSQAYFFYRRLDPNVMKGIPGASSQYSSSLVMAKGNEGGYYLAVSSEDAAKTMTEQNGWDGYVRGNNIPADTWHDFSRSKAVCLDDPEKVNNFLEDRSKVDLDRLADWVK